MPAGNLCTIPLLVGPDFSVPGKPTIYFLRFVELPFVKIGKAKNRKDRCREHQCASPFPMEVIMLASDHGRSEVEAHTFFRESRFRAEWFHFDANFERLLSILNDAGGDIAAAHQASISRLRSRVTRWRDLSLALYSISDLARHFANKKVPMSSVGGAV